MRVIVIRAGYTVCNGVNGCYYLGLSGFVRPALTRSTSVLFIAHPTDKHFRFRVTDEPLLFEGLLSSVITPRESNAIVVKLDGWLDAYIDKLKMEKWVGI